MEGVDDKAAEMGDVGGATLVHLQCHFGLDTLSWARRGAVATGVDFSPSALAAARDLASRAGLPAEFVEANVYGAVEALGRRTFDVVYTSIGAIIWLPDIARWVRPHVRRPPAPPAGEFAVGGDLHLPPVP